MYKIFVAGLLASAVSAVPTPEQSLDCFAQENDMLSCFAVKAVSNLNRAARSADLKIIDGVTFVRDTPLERTGKSLKSEAEIMSELPRDLTDKTVSLAGQMFDSAVAFFKSHSLEIAAPQDNAVGRTFDQGGRKLNKKTMGAMMGGFGLKLLALLPLFLGALVFMTVKALFIGKIALLIAGILAFQKLFAGGAASAYSIFGKTQPSTWFDANNQWNTASANTGAHTGYYRSLNDRVDATKTAYSAQQPETTNEAQ